MTALDDRLRCNRGALAKPMHAVPLVDRNALIHVGRVQGRGALNRARDGPASAQTASMTASSESFFNSSDAA